MKKYQQHYKEFFKGASKNQIKRVLYNYFLISCQVQKVYQRVTGLQFINFKLKAKKIVKKYEQYQDEIIKDSVLEFIASHNVPEETINHLIKFYDITEQELVNACKID